MCHLSSFFVILERKTGLNSSEIRMFRGRLCHTGCAVDCIAKMARVYEGEARYSRKLTLTIVIHKD